ncbi:MAG: HAD family phosphatase [Ruminococcus sp.]|nr:HAD family phosphatase [Ruminococcus sp.]
MEQNTLHGAILDLDGTLLDSMGVWSEIDRELLKSHGIEPPEDISNIVKKMTIEESSQYFIDRFGLPLTVQEIADIVESMAAEQYRYKLQLKEGVLEFLDGLDRMGIKYGIATATYPDLARAAIDRLGLSSRIQFLVTEAEFGSGKKEPYIYYECAKRLSLGKRQIIVAEDALHSIMTAKKAGFFTAGVFDRATPTEEWQQICALATVTVKKISDLLRLI